MLLSHISKAADIFEGSHISSFNWITGSLAGRLYIAGSIGLELLKTSTLSASSPPQIEKLSASTLSGVALNLMQEQSSHTASAEEKIITLVEKAKKEGKIPKPAMLSLFAGIIQNDGTITTVATINETEIVPVASMNKVAIAVCLFHQLEAKNIPYTLEHEKHLKEMLINSDNASTNKIIRLIGKMENEKASPKESAVIVQKILREKFYEYCSNICIEIIPEDKAHSGQAYHTMTTAKDHAALLAAIECEQVSGALFLKKIMVHKNHNRLLDYARQLPSGTIGINKTGSTSGTIGDGAVIRLTGLGKGLVIVAIFNQPITSECRKMYKTYMKDTGHFLGEITDCIYMHLHPKQSLPIPQLQQ